MKVYKKDFRGALKLHKAFRESTPTRARKVNISLPTTAIIMGPVDSISYRTTHGAKVVLYRHDFAPGSRPTLASGPKRGQLLLIGGRYHVTARGIVDLAEDGAEIDNPTHGENLPE